MKVLKNLWIAPLLLIVFGLAGGQAIQELFPEISTGPNTVRVAVIIISGLLIALGFLIAKGLAADPLQKSFWHSFLPPEYEKKKKQGIVRQIWKYWGPWPVLALASLAILFIVAAISMALE